MGSRAAAALLLAVGLSGGVSASGARAQDTAAGHTADGAGVETRPAEATAPAPNPAPFVIGRWFGRGHFVDGAGVFTHCAARANYSNGVAVTLIIERTGDFSMLFTDPRWRLPVGETYDSGLAEEDAAAGGLQATVVGENRIAVQFGNDPERYLPRIAWGYIRVWMPGGLVEFRMPQAVTVVEAVRSCVARGQTHNARLRAFRLARDQEQVAAIRRRGRCLPPVLPRPVAPEPREAAEAQPVSAVPRLARERRVPVDEAFLRGALRLVLDQAAIDGLQFLPDNLIARSYPGADQAWLAGPVTGFAQRVASRAAADGPMGLVTAETLRCPASVQVEPGETTRLDGTVLASVEAWCPFPDNVLAYAMTVVERGDRRIVLTHCADAEASEGAIEADGRIRAALQGALPTW